MEKEEEMELFLVQENGIAIEFPLSYLLEVNFAYHGNKEENVKELNEFIQAIEKFRDNL